MASAASSSTLCPLQQQQNYLFPKYLSLSRGIRFHPRNQQPPFRIRASSAIALDPVYPLSCANFVYIYVIYHVFVCLQII